MSEDTVIKVDHVTKAFRLRGGARTLKSAVLELFGQRGAAREFKALHDVHFDVKRGETLGIIGANGAGKSTLLSLISGTMRPTTGSISTSGSISSLLELGAGFHPDLTGRENVFLYGAVMGLSRRQMLERFDAIVDFAGIRDFIDQPVKHYSSGMYVRLGFAVAVEVDPDILLIDEVLAVGDADFQRKCLAKMEQFRKSGKTMLIISHDLRTIQSISDRILLLDEGKTVCIGSAQSTISAYQSLSGRKGTKSMAREWGTGEVSLTGVKCLDATNTETDRFVFGQPLAVKISFKAEHRIENPVFGFSISTKDGTLVYGSNTQIEAFKVPAIEGDGEITLKIGSLAMSRGTYLLSFSVHSADHTVNYHRLDHVLPVYIEAEKNFEGCCYMPCRWSLEK